MLFLSPIFGQVGIGTTDPTKELDINGALRIRTVPASASIAASKDSILIVNKFGDVKRTSAATIHDSYLKTLVKGSLNTGGIVSLTLLGDLFNSSRLIPFTEEFDLNKEFDTTTHIFTALQAGYYEVGVQIRTDNLLTLDTDFGVSILKGTTTDVYAELSRNSSANVTLNVLLTLVSVTPYRQISTLVYLDAGEKIKFHMVTGLVFLNVNLIGNSQENFFSIRQVR